MNSKIQFGLFMLIVLAFVLTACTSGNKAGVSKSVTANSIDCGKNIDCFIEASKTCSPAVWTNQYGLGFQITGPADGKCNMYVEFVDGNCPYEQERLTTMLEGWKNGEWSNDDYDVCNQTSQIIVEK